VAANAKAEHGAETNVADDEAERIRAMFQANAEHWEETQERMSQSVLSYPPKFRILNTTSECCRCP
jgi:hypothetical protein